MALDGAASPPVRAQVSPVIVRALVSWLRRAAGIETVRRAFAGAGLPSDIDHHDAPADTAWFSAAQVARLAEAAGRLTGETELGRRTGEELLAMGRAHDTVSFLVAEGSPGAALRRAVAAGNRVSTVRLLTVTEVGSDYAVVEARYRDPALARPFFCGIATGYYSRLPELFGLDGAALETNCQARGDDNCRYLVTWTAAPTGSEPDVAGSAARSAALVERFEQLQDMAAQLAAAADTDVLVERITDLAELIVPAPRHVLVVRSSDGDVPIVHHRGFDSDEDAWAVAAAVEAGSADDTAVVAPVRSPRTHFGWLAALLPAGAQPTAIDRRVLDAYASHAAAAMEKVAALERARRDRDTSSALLALARSFAQVTTADDVAGRLARATRLVTGSDIAAVWLLDEAGETFTLAGWEDAGDVPVDMGRLRIPRRSIPIAEELLRSGRPMALWAHEATEPVKGLFRRARAEHAVVVPITARGTVFGTVTAAFRGPVPETGRIDLSDILGGLADHAATALDNARMVERLRRQALHDPLTGLPSRTLMEDRAAQALRRADRTGKEVAVLFVDLDRFKKVNDTLGHRAGDEVIRQVAVRFQNALRGSDTLGRLSGDEFIALLPEIDGAGDAVTVAGKLMDALTEPFRVAGREIFISCSVGIACAPEHGRDYGLLMARADAAMYQAKAAGRSTYVIHAVAASGPRRELLDLETALHRALDNDELVVLYQPQVDLTTMRLVGVEALVRWNHPELGLLGPDAFLTIAEDSGLIVAIDAWVRAVALTQARAWLDAGVGPLRVAVNLSTRDLHRPALVHELADAIAAAGVPASNVELEVTDRIVWNDEELPLLLEGLRSIGVRLAIDDFGTGSSVLGRLHRCPVDTLKIDRGFVVDASDGQTSVLEAIVSLARRLDLDVVAEGIETSRQASLVAGYGCDLAQGNFFGEAVTGDEIAALARAMALTAERLPEVHPAGTAQ